MLKALLPALLLTAVIQTANAQSPTLTSATSDPLASEAYIIKVCDTGVSPGASGASVTWNFATGLTVTQTDTGKSIACSALPGTIPLCSAFPGSNLVLSGRGLVNAHTYIATSTSKRSQIGYWQSSDTMLVMTDPMDEVQYPFTYGNSFSDAFAGTLTLGVLSAHHNGTINVVADAYGTLTLPGRSDNVLRVKSTQLFTDSTMILGSPVVLTYNITTYAWYKTGYHSALLTISTAVPVGVSPTGPQKFVSYSPQQIADVQILTGAISAFDLYPNPASDRLNVHFEATGNEHVTVSLTDMLGRTELIASGDYSGTKDISYNTSSLPRGIYIVRLQAGSEAITKKIELQ